MSEPAGSDFLFTGKQTSDFGGARYHEFKITQWLEFEPMVNSVDNYHNDSYNNGDRSRHSY